MLLAVGLLLDGAAAATAVCQRNVTTPIDLVDISCKQAWLNPRAVGEGMGDVQASATKDCKRSINSSCGNPDFRRRIWLRNGNLRSVMGSAP